MSDDPMSDDPMSDDLVPMAPVLPQIEKIVVLMFENRSFDTMLGWLPGCDGIPANAINHYNRWPYAPQHGFPGLGLQRWRVPRQDPWEGMAGVHRQMYGHDNFLPVDPGWGEGAPMKGFAVDYSTTIPGPPDVGEVMGAYTSEELPVLYGLAERFAVSDRWFCSVPTETDPNRAFAFCGTSAGKETDVDAPFKLENKTIFDALAATTKTWALYAQRDFTGQPYTRNAETYSEVHFAGIARAVAASGGRGQVAPYEEFLYRVKHNLAIPDFCFIEPAWGAGVGLDDRFIGVQGNDYHPPTWVGPAEEDLADLYGALVTSRHWAHMAFLITFDEHGGTWDHVSPPPAISPDGIVGPTGFTFTRMGPRVPTILASPYVAAGSVFRAPPGSAEELDHTSIIATVLRWAGIDPRTAGMGQRVAAAPMFDHALGDLAVQPHPEPIDITGLFGDQPGKGPHGMPPGTEHLTLQDIKAAMAEASSVEAFLAALQARADGGGGGRRE